MVGIDPAPNSVTTAKQSKFYLHYCSESDNYPVLFFRTAASGLCTKYDNVSIACYFEFEFGEISFNKLLIHFFWFESCQ